MNTPLFPIDRRSFLHKAAALVAGTALIPPPVQGAASTPNALAGRLFKTLKIGMIKGGPNLVERFRTAKSAGFQGVEMNFPGDKVEEIQKAVSETGLVVDGSVCSSHWSIRHTSADAEVRAKALEHLKQALRNTREVGGHSVLLVAGKGADGPENEIFGRAVENIAKALPLAAELGVQILIENVWNQFLYDHEGNANQSAEKFVKFVDAFASPWVGMHFDIGNHWKYGSMGDWIRQLRHRVLKLDIKGFSRATNKFTAIGEGDIDYADVRKALHEINFHGWIAAEVGGGDLPYLTGVAREIDVAFGL
jgi:L-ribulose-5-phosphate 3-epimerase